MFLLAASGDVQAYQIRAAPASTIAPGVVMASSPALPTQGATEEVTRKREVRLMKNRYKKGGLRVFVFVCFVMSLPFLQIHFYGCKHQESQGIHSKLIVIHTIPVVSMFQPRVWYI